MAKKKVNNKVGQRIRKLRDAKAFSQEYVADEIGMSFGNLGKIERGEVDPNTTNLQNIAKVLQVNVTEFFESDKQVAEPKSPVGFVTKDDLQQGLRHLEALFRAEIQKFREELSVLRDPYKIKPSRKKRK